MKTIKRNSGNDIKIYATTLEDIAFDQIKELGEFEPYQDSKIRIMPDCHAGAGCPKGIPGFDTNTGCDVEKVVGEGIYINMEAVQS